MALLLPSQLTMLLRPPTLRRFFQCRERVEMSFNLTMYQPHLQGGLRQAARCFVGHSPLPLLVAVLAK